MLAKHTYDALINYVINAPDDRASADNVRQIIADHLPGLEQTADMITLADPKLAIMADVWGVINEHMQVLAAAEYVADACGRHHTPWGENYIEHARYLISEESLLNAGKYDLEV